MTEASVDSVVIWLTRPDAGATDMPRRLELMGARVLCAPAMQIRALPLDHPSMLVAAEKLECLQNYRHIIFISGNAVRYGMALIEYHWPQHSYCYAIGSSTARLLREYGVEALQPSPAQMNSEGLVALPELQSIAGDKVLIVRGIGGREWLAQALVARGAEVDYLETYQRLNSGTLPEEISRGVADGVIDFILAASGETVTIIVELFDASLRRALMDVAIVVPGQRVAEIARQAGFKTVIKAANAGDDAMIGAILGATQQQG